MRYHTPSLEEIDRAHQVFEANEPRWLFYRAATELVDLAMRRASSLTLAEALGVLLQTWNVSFYRFHREFDHQHLLDIEDLLTSHEPVLLRFRHRSIGSLSPADLQAARTLFQRFEEVLGTIGASKALHLLAPRFFPLWDRGIATKGYHLNLRKVGRNADTYCRFMEITKAQCDELGSGDAIGRNLLKAIDEYNYCKYTRGWIRDNDTANQVSAPTRRQGI
jgi:hypothetical protein